jgi:hypothetical protein
VIKCQKLKEQIEGPGKKSVIGKLEVKGEGELGTKGRILTFRDFFIK